MFPSAPLEGVPFSGTVASFTDTDPGTSGDPTTDPTEYSATINWGDGTTSPGTIVYTGTPGNFTVTAGGTPQAYAEEGTQIGNFFVTINHGALAPVSTPAIAVTVADAALTATATPVTTAVYATVFSGEVATFTDADPTAPASDFPLANVTINWGDGSTSSATAITQPGGVGTAFDVFGSHTYGKAGATASPLQVTITDVGGSVSNTTNYTPTVDPYPISYTIKNDSQTYGSPANLAVDLPDTISTGINGENLDISYSSAGDTTTADVGNYNITGSVFDGTGLASNYSVTLTNGSLAVTQANAKITVNGYSGIYDGTGHGATGSATGVNGEDLSNLLNLGASFTDVPGGTANWTFAGNTDYKSASGGVAITNSQANAAINVSGYSGVYDGSAHGATGSATGVSGEDLSSLLNLGASFTDVPGGAASWSFAGNTDYRPASGSVAITISQADATINVSGYSGVYDGNAHGATGSATGVNGEDLSNLLNLGASFTDVPGGTANWTFAGNTDYKSASGGVAITISQANAAINVSGYSGAYDGSAHGATGSATGVSGEDLSSLLNLGTSFTDVPGGTANWSFAGNSDYKPASGSVAITISQASANISVKGYSSVYDGNAHGATGTATGVKGEDLSSLLNLGATFIDVPGGTASWSFAGNTDYKPASGSVAITISQASANISVKGYSSVYDGNAHGATGTATGVKGEDLSSLLNLGATFIDVPGGTASWSFAGNTDYKPASGSVAITISQADATINVSGYSGVYDGNAHGATGSATGVKGEDLSSLLNLGASFTDVPGGTANWSFAGNTDYKPVSGSVAITISQADASISVHGYSSVYDGNAHSATGSATGVKGEDLSSLLNLGASFTDVPGGTANWSFAGNTDYKPANGSVAITIGQAGASINVSGYSGAYDGNAHGATGSATGVEGEDLCSLLNLGASFTDVPGGTANWSFAGNTDYKPASGSVAITISQADATIDVSGYSGAYDGNAHGATGSATGVKGEDLSSLLNLGAAFTDVPGGTANWAFAGNTDYKPASGSVAITISQADATIDVSGYSGAYDASAHGATGSATGVSGEDLSSLLNLGASFTDGARRHG